MNDRELEKLGRQLLALLEVAKTIGYSSPTVRALEARIEKIREKISRGKEES